MKNTKDGASETYCQQYSSDTLYIGLVCFVSVIVVLTYAILITKWLKRRKSFPILERSPWLVFLAAIASLINFIIIPVTLLVSLITDKIYINPNWKMDKQNDFFIVAQVLRSIFISLEYMLYLSYFLRTIRVVIVFSTKIDNEIVKRLFSSERILAAFVLGICAIFFLFAFFNENCLSSFFYPLKDDSCDDENLKSYWLTLHVIVSFILLILTYWVRGISREYSLLNESMCVLFICIIFYWVQDIGGFVSSTFKSMCAGPFPFLMVLYTARHLLIILVIMIHPMKAASRKIIPLPPSIAVEDLKFFLVDEGYFLIFYKFLENLERISMINKAIKTYETTYLRLYLDIKMINSKNNSQNIAAIRAIIENYVLKGKEKDAIPSHISKELLAKYAEGFLFIEDLGRVYNFCITELNRLYGLFKQTKSFRKIKMKLRQNDIVNNRLFKYRMVSDGF